MLLNTDVQPLEDKHAFERNVRNFDINDSNSVHRGHEHSGKQNDKHRGMDTIPGFYWSSGADDS